MWSGPVTVYSSHAGKGTGVPSLRTEWSGPIGPYGTRLLITGFLSSVSRCVSSLLRPSSVPVFDLSSLCRSSVFCTVLGGLRDSPSSPRGCLGGGVRPLVLGRVWNYSLKTGGPGILLFKDNKIRKSYTVKHPHRREPENLRCHEKSGLPG